MYASLRALLEGLIDYAGLFPPAKLLLPEALANFLRYSCEPEAWILGRFICPTTRLSELAEFAEEIKGSGLLCSALGRGGATSDVGQAALLAQADLADMDGCTRRHHGAVRFAGLELKMPDEAIRDSAACRELLTNVRQSIGTSGLEVFFEVAVENSEALKRVIAELRQEHSGWRAGLKVRCGGLDAKAFPSSEQLALALVECVRQKVPFKATAGLHHPFPQFDPAVQTRMHGFINLFVAGVMAMAHDLPVEQVRAILEDDSSQFACDDSGLRWRGLAVSTETIRVARQEILRSFGSCSFDEPRDDLRKLGWL